jgi:hypothetical protein
MKVAVELGGAVCRLGDVAQAGTDVVLVEACGRRQRLAVVGYPYMDEEAHPSSRPRSSVATSVADQLCPVGGWLC